ncbi:MAG: hypothetical protein ACE5Q6_23355 [Dehalococcoidia bacterium]
MQRSRTNWTDDEQNWAEESARGGMTIAEISRRLNVNYWKVYVYVNSVGAFSWRGSRTIINRRLRRLASEPDPEARKQLLEDLSESIGYIYEEARTLSGKLLQVRDVLDK